MFRDRTQAGAGLAAALPDLRGRPNVTIVGLARGGVEVAAETARLLEVPMDVLCVKKVPMPGYPELAMGAVAPMGERFTNRRIASVLSHRRDRGCLRRGHRPRPGQWTSGCAHGLPLNVAGRIAVITDDGAATGASVRAALAAVRNAMARQIVIALPVLPQPSAERLGRECDRLVTLRAPQRFRAVSQFYEEFPQVSEDRVRELLAAHLPAMELT